MKLSEAEYQSILSRPAIAKRNPSGDMSTCKTCGKVKSDRNAKFCSLPCAYADKDRVAWHKPKERGTATCAGCGVEFKLKTNGGKQYCSQLCASKHIGKRTMAKNRQVRPPTTRLTLTCAKCGKTFQRWKSNIVNAKWNFCSPKCSANHSAFVKERVATAKLNGAFSPTRSHSRGVRGWRVIGGQRVCFRSRMEANYARFMTWCGVEWEYEPKTFWFNNIKRGVVSYTPDFFLPKENRYIECKGWMDKKSATKLKRMKKYFPDIRLDLVDWKAFRALEKTVCNLIPDWEGSKPFTYGGKTIIADELI